MLAKRWATSDNSAVAELLEITESMSIDESSINAFACRIGGTVIEAANPHCSLDAAACDEGGALVGTDTGVFTLAPGEVLGYAWKPTDDQASHVALISNTDIFTLRDEAIRRELRIQLQNRDAGHYLLLSKMIILGVAEGKSI